MSENDLVPLLNKLINQPFPSMKKLIEAVKKVGVPGLDGFGEGGRNTKLAKKQLARYVKVCKLTEIDPSCKKANACTITEVFNPPLPKEDDRGKKGKYIDCIKPLILNTGNFRGKTYELYNQWGLFYEFELQQAGKNAAALSQITYGSYNPWKIEDNMPPGEIKYRSCMNYQINDRTKYALESLASEEKLEWSDITMFIPDIKYETTGSTVARLKTWGELQKEYDRRQRLIEIIAAEENCVLLPELLAASNMTSSHYSNMSYSEYSDQYYSNRQTLIPLHTTAQEDTIYQNYQLYLRQLAYSIQMGYNRYVCVDDTEDIANEYRFYSDWQRRSLYNKLDNDLRSILLGWKTVWKEIKFHVYEDKKETLSSETVASHVETLEKLYTKFMAGKMEPGKELFRASPRYLDDCNIPFGSPTAYHLYSLSKSFAAQEIQKHLEGLYLYD